MMFQRREDIPDAFGPPATRGRRGAEPAGNPIPNWAPTRYVDWTSWRGREPLAERRRRHVDAGRELGPERLRPRVQPPARLPDNYNNPFADTDRNYTGYWEMMSRGTFNGPGGTHNRWQIPNQGGSALGPHHLLHFKNQLGVLRPTSRSPWSGTRSPTQGVAVVEHQGPRVLPDGRARRPHRQLRHGGDLAGNCANQGYVGDQLFYCPNRTAATCTTGWRSSTGSATTRSPRPRRPAHEEPEQRDAARLDDRPEPGGHRDDRLLPARRDAGRGRPRRSAPAERRDVPRRHELRERVRVRGHVQQAPLLRARRRRDADGVLYYRVAVRRFDDGRSVHTRRRPGQPGQDAAAPGFLATCTFPLTNTGRPGRACSTRTSTGSRRRRAAPTGR